MGWKTIIVDVEVLDVSIDEKFLLGHIWIHVKMTIVSSYSRVNWFPHCRKILMIDKLDYYMVGIVVQPNVPFIRDSLEEFQDIRVRYSKNDSLMGNFVIRQPLFATKVS